MKSSADQRPWPNGVPPRTPPFCADCHQPIGPERRYLCPDCTEKSRRRAEWIEEHQVKPLHEWRVASEQYQDNERKVRGAERSSQQQEATAALAARFPDQMRADHGG